MTVLDNIMVGRHHLLRNSFLTGMLYWLGGAQREEIAHRREVEEIIDFLEIQHVRKAIAGTLPYGLRKRVELARAMALKPKLILLDEPMAGMNLEEKEDMARYIVDLNEEWGMTVLMIEHDMGVVMDISHRVMVLDFGRKIAEGSPEEVLADPHVRRAYLGEADDALGAQAGIAGRCMIDYAARAAEADTLPKLLRRNAREHAARWRCGRRSSASGAPSPGPTTRRGCAPSRSGCASSASARGDVVGLIGDNRPDWVMGEIAAHALGAMSLGIYRDALDDEVAYLLGLRAAPRR